MNISKLSVKRPVAMAMVVLVFVVIGLYSFTSLPIDMFPNMTMPMAVVSASYSGVAPQEMENIVTKPIEQAIASTSNIKNITSSTSEGNSMVMAEFEYGTDMDIASMDMREKLEMISYVLPDDMNDPTIFKLDPSMMAVGTISISKKNSTPSQVKTFAEDEIASKLESISGVASVSVTGGEDREIQIDVDPNAMSAYGIGLANITNALRSDNVNSSGGNVESTGKSLSVRTLGEFMSLNDLEFVPITLPNGTVIYLRDIAKINDTSKEITEYSRLNDENCITVSIQKQSGSNTVQVMDSVKKQLEKIRRENPDVEIRMIFDQADTILMTVKSVAENAIIGGLLAVIILLFFLRSIRTTLVMAISIPTSIITTFAAMYFCGITVNMVSLAGLMLGVGMLVDSSIVMLENIFKMRSEGLPARQAAIDGAKQVTGAITASVLTTCIVYLPVAFVNDMAGIIFREMALVIVFSQLASLMVTLLVVPAIASKLPVESEDTKLKKWLEPFENGIKKLTDLYEKALRYALSHRRKTVSLAIATLVFCLCLVPFIGFEFMGTADSGQINVSVEMPKGTLLDDTDAVVHQIEGIVSLHPEVTDVYTTVGSGGIMSMGGSSSYTGTISLTVTDKTKRKQSLTELMDEIRSSIGNIPGAQVSVSDGGGMSIGNGGGVSLNIKGDEHEKLAALADEVVAKIKNVNGLREVTSSVESSKPEIQIQLDRMKLSKYGLTTASASGLIKSALEGSVASTYREDGEEYDIRVQIPEKYRKTKDNLKSIRLLTATGAQITIGDIANITDAEGPVSITRDNQKPYVTVSAASVGRSLSSINAEVKSITDKIELPGGYSIEFGGDMESMQTSFSALAMALMLGILLVYMVMAAQFESLSQPFVIIFTIPLAMIGVILSFVLTRANFGITAFIGLIMLAGVVVNNAIVLLDFVNTSKDENYHEKPANERRELLITAGRSRLRPILMTTLTTVLAYIPTMLSNGQSAEMMKPLAFTVFGGMVVSTVLTLVFIPVLYSKLEDTQIKRKLKKQTGKNGLEF